MIKNKAHKRTETNIRRLKERIRFLKSTRRLYTIRITKFKKLILDPELDLDSFTLYSKATIDAEKTVKMLDAEMIEIHNVLVSAGVNII